MVAPDGAHLARPAVRDAQHAFGLGFVLLHRGLRVEHDRLHAEERTGRRAGLRGRRPRKRGQHVAAGLGLPERVDDRAFALSDVFVVPGPGFGVDRLTDRAQHLEIGQIVFLDPFRPLAHQRANRGGRGVELVDLVLFANGPETARIRIGRHAFEHDRGRAIRERPVDDVAVAGDPAHIGGAPEHVAIMVVERVLHRHRRVDEIAAGGMHDALRLAGRARGVKDEQRIFRVHRTRRTFGRDVLHHRLHVDIATVDPRGLVAGMLHDEAAHLVRAVQQRGVGIRLERCAAATARSGVGGDDDLGARVVDAVGECVRREAREDDRVDRADTRTGEHRVSRFRDHRQIDHDAVAAHHALARQHVGEAVHLLGQLLVGDVLRRGFRIVGLEDDRGLVAARGEVTVDTVHAGVQHAVLEPFDIDMAEGEIGVLHLGIRRDPVEALTLAAPELLRIGDRFLIHLAIFRGVGMGVLEARRDLFDLWNLSHLVLRSHELPPSNFALRHGVSACRPRDSAGPLPRATVTQRLRFM